MSDEPAEIVRESFRRFDPADLGEWSRLLDPAIRMTAADGWPEQGPFVGPEACVRQFERLFEDWSDYRFSDPELVAESADWVVVTWVLEARGRGSGLDVRLDLASAFRVTAARIAEAHFRWTADEARAAAGLP